MSYETYRDIYNLITSHILFLQREVDSHLDFLADNPVDFDDDCIQGAFLCVKKDYVKLKFYNDLLERFKKEVEEPEE